MSQGARKRSIAVQEDSSSVFAVAAQRVVFTDEERRRQGPTAGQLRIAYIERAAGLVDRALGSEAAGVHDDLWREHVEGNGHFLPLLVEPEFRKLKEEVFERSAAATDADSVVTKGQEDGP